MIYNNEVDYNAAKLRVDSFIQGALADGWELSPTYNNESVDSAARLTKDGFVISIIRRSPSTRAAKWEIAVSGWGPDSLCIVVPKVYSMQGLIDATKTCNICRAENVMTQRYSFAGRCCEKCIDNARKKYEYRGWCD